MSFELVPVKYNIRLNNKPAQHYVERRTNGEGDTKWFVVVESEFCDLHLSAFIDFQEGFDSSFQAALELEKYIDSSL